MSANCCIPLTELRHWVPGLVHVCPRETLGYKSRAKWKFLVQPLTWKPIERRRTNWIAVPGMSYNELSPKCSLAPPRWNILDQESGGDLCEIFEFWSFLFLHSKYVNNVCKLFQLPTGTSPLHATRLGTSVSPTLAP